MDVTDFYSDSASGGVRTYLHAKAAAMEGLGVRHAIVVPGERDGVERIGATRLHRVRGPSLPVSRGYRVMGSAERLVRILAVEQPEVIEVGSPFLVPGLVRRALGTRRIPTVGFYHADVIRTFAEPYVPNPWAAPLRVTARSVARGWVRRVYRRFTVTVAASRSVADELRGFGIPDVRCIGLGVDLSTFRPMLGGRSAWPLPGVPEWPDLPVGIFVGRFCAEKRLDVVLEANARLPSSLRAHLVLVGGGPLEGWLRREAGKRSDLTVLSYVQDRSRLAELLAGADFYLASGPGETFGLAIAEALACGLPVLAVERGAAPDRVEGSGAGELYAHGDPRDCAASMVRLIGRLGRSLREAARAHAERSFDWRDTFAALAALYREVARAAG